MDGNNVTKPRAILWTAVSTQAQADDEKASLPAQEADLRALAEKHGWEVIDVLRVPGHSRHYYEWHRLVMDSRERGIDAFYRLDQHLNNRDFDILAVRDGDRFARTQTLHAFIVESVCVKAGATIWSLADGKIDVQGARMYTAMSGYRAAGDIDRLVKYRDMALNLKPEKGLPVAGRPLWGFKIVRNELGKATAYIIDESNRRAFDDLAELILAGVAWDRISDEMNRRGHRNSGGEEFKRSFFYRTVFHPVWWGHAARNFRHSGRSQEMGDWTFDASVPPPEGVRVWRDAYEPIWKGDTATAVQAELRRRHRILKGRATTENTRRFSGLIICAGCGHVMHSTQGTRSLYLSCGYRWRGGTCTQERSISEKKIIEFLNPLLRELKAAGDPESIFGGDGRQRNDRVLEQARAELAQVHSNARAMAKLYAANAGKHLEAIYAAELAELEKQAAEIEAVISQAEANSATDEPRRATLQELDVDGIWEQPWRVINQTLHAILGQWRLVADNGAILGYTKVKLRNRRRPRNPNRASFPAKS